MKRSASTECSYDGGIPTCRDSTTKWLSELSEAARLGIAPYDEHCTYINTSTPLILRQRETRKAHNNRKVNYAKVSNAGDRPNKKLFAVVKKRRLW
jgi:hypothetical protein